MARSAAGLCLHLFLADAACGGGGGGGGGGDDAAAAAVTPRLAAMQRHGWRGRLSCTPLHPRTLSTDTARRALAARTRSHNHHHNRRQRPLARPPLQTAGVGKGGRKRVVFEFWLCLSLATATTHTLCSLALAARRAPA
ncbi:uncharacterized protein SETTUDRAFT_36612 [Exserohilum turcica Et28A]|uniref:Uncharacterized protein n=1 Tax=Exserohilum turcicum (strain 28A) TaxID=671987 RepID=R0J2G9_EXST2|nr:uncharacterized protein SETTUDRAFT_36612 [Exserohilum turcica Et28A]EOA91130.1 hypothetical protein SETTUDRAFT_36612 [Exserohilum turcica Et28A]